MRVYITTYLQNGRLSEYRCFEEFHSDEFDIYFMKQWTNLENGSIKKIEITRAEQQPDLQAHAHFIGTDKTS